MSRKTISQVPKETFTGKHALVRVDFNVPQSADGTITDDSRIRAAVPTIEHLRKSGAKVLLMSHLGRPKGKTDKFSLAPVAKRLSELLGIHVPHLSECIGPKVKEHADKMQAGDVCLLENVRFHDEEEANDPEFAKKLAEPAHIYVNDAFGTAHRAHASTEGVSRYLRPALAGFLMEKEIKALSAVLHTPHRPFACVIGGAKVSSKIGVLENLVQKVDVLVIGGAMAFSFLKAQGKSVGKSLVEDDRLEFCLELMRKAKDRGVKVILPLDVICAAEFAAGVPTTCVSIDAIPSDQMGLDVGPKTIELIDKELASCKTILWNGPLGALRPRASRKLRSTWLLSWSS